VYCINIWVLKWTYFRKKKPQSGKHCNSTNYQEINRKNKINPFFLKDLEKKIKSKKKAACNNGKHKRIFSWEALFLQRKHLLKSSWWKQNERKLWKKKQNPTLNSKKKTKRRCLFEKNIENAKILDQRNLRWNSEMKTKALIYRDHFEWEEWSNINWNQCH
jgi:hypothetical protein